MPQATAGIQSTVDVNSSPTAPMTRSASPATWSVIWFIIAVLIVLGFHVRVFGHPVPPVAHLP